VSEASTDQPGFSHEAFFYVDEGEFLAGTVPFVEAGLEAGESILIVLPGATGELLRGELSGGERIHFAAMEELGRNPARLIPAWRDFLEENANVGRGVRGIGEPIWAGRSDAEVDECQRHESLLNLAFDGGPAWSLMCPYDSARLEERVLEDALRSHPLVSRPDCVTSSDFYAEPGDRDPFEGPLAPPAAPVAEISFTAKRLSEVRRFAAEQARSIGLDPARVEDLVLAVNELATNSLQHSHGRGSLRIWRETAAIACEVDSEDRIDRPLAGRRRPGPTQLRGRGLWLVNQLCDLVQIRSGGSGSVVRLQMSLEGEES
jgi:anti-sigma regulatory factor (Ser/Thr protein kinase)